MYQHFKNFFVVFGVLSVLSFISGMASDNDQPKVAVIGAGGAGLTTAWLLENNFNITIYENSDRLGGHADTVQVTINGQTSEIDAGFEFFTDQMFPNFNKLLKILNVPVNQFPLTYTFYKTDGSDTLVLPPYNNGHISWDDFTPHHLFDLLQFKHFLSEAAQIVQTADTSLTLQQYIDSLTLENSFKNDFLYPFFGGAWGVSPDEMKTFAAYDLLKWVYINQPSGLGAPVWNEVVGGTQAYVKALAAQLTNAQIKLSTTITSIYSGFGTYFITEADGTVSEFDHIIFATNANQAAELLKDIPETFDLRSILEKFEYYYTTIALHGDTRFMPPSQSDWSIANIRYDGVNSALTVYKPWKSPTPIYRSWLTYDVRPDEELNNPMPSPLYAVTHYYHPKLNLQYFEAQKGLAFLQGNNNLWFAGLYTYDVDSHESAIMSAIRVAQKLAPFSEHLKQLTAQQ